MDNKISIINVSVNELMAAEYNPRKWDEAAVANLKESITRFGIVDPIIVNNSPERKNVVIGGYFRLKVVKQLGYTEVPVVYLNISDIAREKELNLRLNRNTCEWDWNLLAEFDESFLSDVGFNSQDLDKIFDFDIPEQFDLEEELIR